MAATASNRSSKYNKSYKQKRKTANKPITTSTTVTGRRVKRLKAAKPKKSSKPSGATKTKKTVKARKAPASTKTPKPVTTSKKTAGVIKPKSTAKRRAILPAKRAKHRVVSATKKSVKFSLDAPSGLNVTLSGAFNSWVPQAMTKGQDGLWSITLQLLPGFYPYRFLVDTERQDDPNNSRKTVDPLQGFCSVCEVL